MSTVFPRVGKKTLGYDVGQVNSFLAAARRAYDQPDLTDDETDADTGAVESSQASETIETVVAEKAAVDADGSGTPLTAEGIRHTAFAMHKGGYSPEHVDAALERLEDAFAARERDHATRTGREQDWMGEAESAVTVLVARLSRAPGKRFTRTSLLTVGYKRVDVDRFANKVVKHFRNGRELTVDEVRTAVFRPERGGYREAQVDLVLDSVVDVLLAMR